MEITKKITVIILCLASAALLQLLLASFLTQLGERTYTTAGFGFAKTVMVLFVPWSYGLFLLPFTTLGVYWFLKETAGKQGDDRGDEDPA